MSLEVRALTAGYGAVLALRDVSFVAEPGRVTAVLGPNGAGKSTLVRALAGVVAHEGSVGVSGRDLRSGRPRDRARAGLAAVTDRRDLVPTLAVERYLRLTLDAAGCERAYETFPALRPLAGRRCGLLSGGEAQMLAMGRALGGRPAVAVLDEISQGLAPAVVARLLPAVRAAADAGAAVVLAEQLVHVAAGIADHAVVLAHGEVTYEGALAGAPIGDLDLRTG